MVAIEQTYINKQQHEQQQQQCVEYCVYAVDVKDLAKGDIHICVVIQIYT